MTLKAKKSKWEIFCVAFVFYIDYIEKNGQFMPQELFPFAFLAPRVLNLNYWHYYLSENI